MDASSFDLSQLSPEQLQQLMALGSLDEQGGDLDKQMEQAQALGQQQTSPHSTWGGAALGGLAGLINQLKSGHDVTQIQGQKAALRDKKSDVRGMYAQLLRGSAPPPAPGAPQPVIAPQGMMAAQGPQMPQQQPPPALAAQSPFGYGGGPYGYAPGGQ